MKISFNWLKQYLNFDLTPEETGKYLTDCGLEVEAIDTFESVRGGLKGLVIGEVLTCEPHPDSDHLHVTTVDIGNDQILNVVCGATNVAKGQKVVVATIGTILYDNESSFTIKKSKIRGVVSEGMICAEDEIGLGSSHDGIMVLPEEAKIGMPAAQYFKVESDYIFEIGLTPNRSDAISHYGVARDLYAVLKINGVKCSGLVLPTAYDFTSNSRKNGIEIVVENKEACPRYSGLTFDKVKVKESPEWLKNRLKSVGIRPINNIVDITQFVMFEVGQPLHAFDADKIIGKKVIVKNLPSGTLFNALDGNEIKLDHEDLMICNSEGGMCIAGVYGGLDSGVTENTTSIFLESAYFNPVSVRKTSKRHNLKTDAAFRFERGCDPEITIYALKRAANLIKELSDAIITSEIMDVYPTRIERSTITLRFDEINRIAGKEIDKQTVSTILLLLGMEVQASGEEQLMVTVPLYKNDVTRPIDLIEEILRIYGYNNIEIPEQLSYNIHLPKKTLNTKLQERISLYLAANGFYEMMNNSLTKSTYARQFDFIDESKSIPLLNPLSNELSVMRQTMLFSGLETISRNLNNKNINLRLFEFGKTYNRKSLDHHAEVTEQIEEKDTLSLFVTGKMHDDVWNHQAPDLDLFYLKNMVLNLMQKINYPLGELATFFEEPGRFLENLIYSKNDKELIHIGQVHPKVLKYFDIKKPVYYAEVDVQLLYADCHKNKIIYSPIPAFPAVKRDLALVVDQDVSYEQLERIAYRTVSKWLKSVTLFDVYEGTHIETGKKSYALNFILQHSEKTMTEEEIQKIMKKLIDAFDKEVGAKLR